jgi:methionyl-tRNA formyltransferase
VNVLLLTGAPRSSRIRDFLAARTDRLQECSLPLTLEAAREMAPDFMVIHGYGPIIKAPVVDAWAGRIINLHNTFLPWGRGLMGNVWSYFEDVPKGVSLHSVDAGVDTGDVIARRPVSLGLEETLQSSWEVLMDALERMFMEQWEGIAARRAAPTPQAMLDALGTHHDRKAGDWLLSLCPQRWQTPVAHVAALGREYREDPAAFAQRCGGERALPPLPPPTSMPQGKAGVEGEVSVRPATAEDSLINWLWVNDPVTRAMFKKNHYVGWSEHEQWYGGLLRRQDMFLYIGLAGGRRIGNVRFDRRAPGTYEISINMDPRHRGQGLGHRMLAAAIGAFRARAEVSMFFAMAKKSNPPSIKTFARLGIHVTAEASPLAVSRGFDPETEVYMERRL